MEVLSDEEEGMALSDLKETAKKNNEEAKRREFDRRLPIIHSYLGDVNQGELSGQEIKQRQFEEPGNTIKVSVFVINEVCLFPGQKMPIQFHQRSAIQFVHNAHRQQNILALFTAEDPNFEFHNAEEFSSVPCHQIGTLFQMQNILENGENDVRRMTIQVIGRQRCRLVRWPLQRHQIHSEDHSVVICDQIDVVVLDEKVLPPSLFPLNECCSFGRLKADQRFKLNAALSAHSEFSLKQCSTDKTVQMLVLWLLFWFKQRQIELILQQGLTPFSFWVAANIPMSLEMKLALLDEVSTDRRLRTAWRIVSQMDSIVCSNCAQSLCNVSDIVNLSTGSNSTLFTNSHGFVHDLFTIKKVSGILLNGQPSTEFSWFPGYAWTVMQCATCGHHLGWRFSSPSLIPARFFGVSRRSIQLNCFKE
ncbi:hypothetical protein niasHS_010242 [Heterodera schachtii]|uniref:Protein cereblon n=1 Tax=Heterodera schachtii TaxID=97005 RepID=A0ABD2J6Y1_HETSC